MSRYRRVEARTGIACAVFAFVCMIAGSAPSAAHYAIDGEHAYYAHGYGPHDLPPVPYPLHELIDIVARDRSLIAIDSRAIGPFVRARLRAGERVLWNDFTSEIGIAVTDDRVLAVTAGATSWAEVEYGVHESLPVGVLLGESIALVLTSDRAIGLHSGSGRFVEHELDVHERFVDALTGEHVAVVLTDKRVLGLSTFAAGFFEEKIGAHEEFETAHAAHDSATVTTGKRVLVFRAGGGAWSSRRLGLR